MNYSDWKPLYNQILLDFGFDRILDENAGEILIELIKSKINVNIQELSDLINNKVIYVFGAGPDLLNEIGEFKKKAKKNVIIIAADGATSALMKYKLIPDIIVTDLDGHIPDQLEANKLGSIVIIHAHGDNIQALKQWVPKFQGKVLATTQSKPDEKRNLYNLGGFTDGDRAIFIASHFNAGQINLIAFNFQKIGTYSFKYESETKLRKLTWANLLIGMIDKPKIKFESFISK
jgi:uncharacterized Rossmann fold enzyme